MSKITLVTGLWDLGRDNLTEFKRSFDHYIQRFDELLSLEIDFIVFVPKEMERHVTVLRGHNKKTTVIVKELDEMRQWFPFYDKVQSIRTSEQWLTDQPSWLLSSPQAQLPDYNPVVMSKMFLLNDAVIIDGSRSDYYFWIDAGLTTTVGFGFLENLKNLPYYMESNEVVRDKFLFINYPYGQSKEIHGFDRIALEKYAKREIRSIPRGGFFGGDKESIRQMNGWYYDILSTTLNDGYMGTEESVFCILDALYSPKIYNYTIEENGLIWPFFHNLKNINTEVPYSNPRKQHKSFNSLKTALYILTYNSPKQVQWLLNSFEVADRNFLVKPDIYLIDNSTDPSVAEEYRALCKKYNLLQIKQHNIGICGARQLAAEHFDLHDYDYYLFFEDDMFLYPPAKARCYAGMDVYTDNLFERSLEIMHLEKYDYLKLSYSEFYGSNRTQWAWYNISQVWREEYFPDKPNLPREGLDQEAPLTVETQFKSYASLNYIEGEYHYCNWPLWTSREGNRKIFLDGKTQHLFEQRWMAETFYKIKQGDIKCAVLALSPINHNRFHFYPADERKEC